MKLRDYLNDLHKKVKADPEILNMEVFYSIDDEGNDFKPVFYNAGIMEDKENSICLN